MRPLVVLVASVLVACGSSIEPGEPGGSAGPGDGGGTTPDGAPPVEDVDVIEPTPPTDAAPSAGDTDGGPSSEVGAKTELRFVAVGDTGKGNDGQRKVAAAIASKCAKDGCDFVQLLGDNIYESGVESTTDPAWTKLFVTPYGDISLPFYAVLGNHDYGRNGLGGDANRAQQQVEYTKVSTKWKMPAKYWQREEASVQMIGLDTQDMMGFSVPKDQQSAVAGWIGASKARWKLAFGHHPYLSNGSHGDAGRYDRIPLSGQNVKKFFDETICGKVDVYFGAHDHDREWIKETCQGTELIISGGGADVRSFRGSHPTYFREASLGFVYVVIAGGSLTAEFVDENGAAEFARTITK
jgi:hypothetical protein